MVQVLESCLSGMVYFFPSTATSNFDDYQLPSCSVCFAWIVFCDFNFLFGWCNVTSSSYWLPSAGSVLDCPILCYSVLLK